MILLEKNHEMYLIINFNNIILNKKIICDFFKIVYIFFLLLKCLLHILTIFIAYYILYR